MSERVCDRRSFVRVASISGLSLCVACSPHLQDYLHTDVRSTPLALEDWPGLRPSDAITALVLRQLRLPGRPLRASQALHYALLWKANICHFGPTLGTFLRNLVDGKYTLQQKPLFFVGADGLLRTSKDDNQHTESHPDQTLALLGMLGCHSRFALTSENSIADGIRSVCARYEFVQEIEWSTLSLVHCLPPLRSWCNRRGEIFSFDSVTQKIFAEGCGRGACSGTHRLQLAVSMLRANEMCGILRFRSRNLLTSFLGNASRLLVRHQHEDGGWGNDWFLASTVGTAEESSIHVTGHHLEWLLAGRSFHRLDDEVIARAVRYCRENLVAFIEHNHDRRRYLCPAVHAAKCVAQWDELYG
ncbi:hypothetical protein Mal65_05550 [Crateriforma conspicua]|nr:hypothetical protein Mal65_05550 [Crateriforma conspicua]